MDKHTLYHHVQGEWFPEPRVAFKDQLVHGVVVSIPRTFVWPVIPSYGGVEPALSELSPGWGSPSRGLSSALGTQFLSGLLNTCPGLGLAGQASRNAHLTAPYDRVLCSRLLPPPRPPASSHLATMEGCFLRSKGKALMLCGQANKPPALKSQGGCAQAGVGGYEGAAASLPEAWLCLSRGEWEEGGILWRGGSSEGYFQVLLSLRFRLGAARRLGVSPAEACHGSPPPFGVLYWGAVQGKLRSVLLPLGHILIQVASGKNEWQGRLASKAALVPLASTARPSHLQRLLLPSLLDQQSSTRWAFCLSPGTALCAPASETTGMTRDTAHLPPPPIKCTG